MSTRRGLQAITIDEQGNVIVQLFNILLEAVAKDSNRFREDVAETYNRIISTLASYVDFSCLHPVKRYLLEQSLMSDIILSHLEYLDEVEEGRQHNKNWLKLSGRTKALIAIALSECGYHSRVAVEGKRISQGLRVEQV